MGVRGRRASPGDIHAPSIQTTTMSDPLKQIKQKLLDEITALEHELSIELPKEIAVARAHGDLSENAEYKFAKERQGYVNARIGQARQQRRGRR